MPDLIFKSAHAFWPSGEWRVNGLMGMTRFGCFLYAINRWVGCVGGRSVTDW
jgi:hypothetical protein